MDDFCNNCAGKNAFEKSEERKVIFHTYWYGEFGRKQAFSIKSLIATQNSYDYEVWLWLDADTYNEDEIVNNKFLSELYPFIKIKRYSVNALLFIHLNLFLSTLIKRVM